MPIHNEIGSIVCLAKSWLLTLDRNRVETPVPTETLRLWLETIISLGTPEIPVDESSRRTVMSSMQEINDAYKSTSDRISVDSDRKY
jgi:hypothetical protein